MREKANLKKLCKYNAVGNIFIELTDPKTGKVREKINEKNHVFLDMFSTIIKRENNDTLISFGNTFKQLLCCLNDDDSTVDVSFPYMKGNVIGFGMPSQGSSGPYRGSYVAANQILGQYFEDRLKWKFQYEFTASQAIGTIRSVGLTYQYNIERALFPIFSTPRNEPSDLAPQTKDGRYAYYINNSGIIDKTDGLFGTIENINLSAIVGSTSNQYKFIAYAPRTKKYYILVHNPTSADRKLYKFSDNTFSNLEQVYNISNSTIGDSYSSSRGRAMYIYGDNIYYLYNTNVIHKVDFVSNTYQEIITVAANNVVQGSSSVELEKGNIADDRYIWMGPPQNYNGVVFSPDTEDVVATVYMGGLEYNLFHPFIKSARLPSGRINYGNNYLYHQPTALTYHKLANPVVKTAENGMIVTYELDIMFDD